MNNEQIVLTENLTASSKGRELPKKYRAVLYFIDGEPTIKVEQPIGGDWYPTGGYWYVEDLMKDPSDDISIDWGQQWTVESGMLEALAEAKKEFIARTMVPQMSDQYPIELSENAGKDAMAVWNKFSGSARKNKSGHQWSFCGLDRSMVREIAFGRKARGLFSE